MKDLKLSLIVPIYNVKKYLPQALDSIVNQTFRNLEILLIDDGSTDGSETLCDEYAARDSRFRVFHLSNGGYGRAINTGLDNATGDYVGIFESDDFLEENYCEELMTAAEESDFDIIRGDYYLHYDQTETKESYRVRANNLWDQVPFNQKGPVHIYQRPWITFTAASIWSGIYKRAFIERNKIRLIETPGAGFQDWPFFLQTLFCARSFYAVNMPLTNYRQTNPNSSINTSDKGFVLFGLYDWLLQRLEEADKARLERERPLLAVNLFKQCRHNYKLITPAKRKLFLEELLTRVSFLKPFLKRGLTIPYASDADREELTILLKRGVSGLYQRYRITRNKAVSQKLFGSLNFLIRNYLEPVFGLVGLVIYTTLLFLKSLFTIFRGNK